VPDIISSWKSAKARMRRIAHACWLDTLRTRRLPTQGRKRNFGKDERQNEAANE
jgi:hypothetical protein